MKKLLVYSHDTYGLGNIRRMLAICEHLLKAHPDLSILLITGSPVIHSLRLPESLDYIKLPCLTRTAGGEYTTKYLNDKIDDAIQLRSDLILAATANFKPDLLMVDKKPLGVKQELAGTLDFLQAKLPQTKQVLILRDILDSPEMIISNWERNGHAAAIQRFYDLVLVLGQREVFDPLTEYRFPSSVVEKTVFCGYIRKEAAFGEREKVRSQMGVDAREKLVLVTPGGGQDGFHVIENYLAGLASFPPAGQGKSLIVCGPEMPAPQKSQLERQAEADSRVKFFEFTGEMISFMAAADLVVSMGGYNTVCEILSLNKPAVVIPRVRPTQEQLIRADRMSRLDLFKTIHADELTPQLLMRDLTELLDGDERAVPKIQLDLNGLPVVAGLIEGLLNRNYSA